MKKPIAILVAGHSNWGKSRTLRALTENKLFRNYQFSDTRFFIRRMSNDDYTEGYRDFIDGCVAAPNMNILAAFCPHFEKNDLRFTEHSLTQLKTQYDLHIFALKYQYNTAICITDQELASMSRFGNVTTFDDGNAEAQVRADALEDFILTVINQ